MKLKKTKSRTQYLAETPFNFLHCDQITQAAVFEFSSIAFVSSISVSCWRTFDSL